MLAYVMPPSPELDPGPQAPSIVASASNGRECLEFIVGKEGGSLARRTEMLGRARLPQFRTPLRALRDENSSHQTPSIRPGRAAARCHHPRHARSLLAPQPSRSSARTVEPDTPAT